MNFHSMYMEYAALVGEPKRNLLEVTAACTVYKKQGNIWDELHEDWLWEDSYERPFNDPQMNAEYAELYSSYRGKP